MQRILSDVGFQRGYIMFYLIMSSKKNYMLVVKIMCYDPD